jgi:hypothetical protein
MALPDTGRLPSEAARLIQAVARAHWRAVESALGREDLEAISGEVPQDFEDRGTGQPTENEPGS